MLPSSVPSCICFIFYFQYKLQQFLQSTSTLACSMHSVRILFCSNMVPWTLTLLLNNLLQWCKLHVSQKCYNVILQSKCHVICHCGFCPLSVSCCPSFLGGSVSVTEPFIYCCRGLWVRSVKKTFWLRHCKMLQNAGHPGIFGLSY